MWVICPRDTERLWDPERARACVAERERERFGWCLYVNQLGGARQRNNNTTSHSALPSWLVRVWNKKAEPLFAA